MISVYLGRVVAWLLWSSMWVAHKLRLIDITISRSAHERLQAGNVMVYANHPSLIETVASRYALDVLSGRPVWTLCDERLFPAKWFESFRCIPVCRKAKDCARSQEMNSRASGMSSIILSQSGIVVVYPEGTRTCKASQKVTDGSGRQVGVCKVTFLEQVACAGAVLQPVWIEHGDCSTPQGFLYGYYKLLRGIPIRLAFGNTCAEVVSPNTIAVSLLQSINKT